jgi:hypothetical protein
VRVPASSRLSSNAPTYHNGPKTLPLIRPLLPWLPLHLTWPRLLQAWRLRQHSLLSSFPRRQRRR